jgi:tetratricopeptide (TPR) repeat protein
MAEHNGGNHGGKDRGPFRGPNNSGGDPRGFRSRENRDSTDGPRRAPGSGERKPYGDRPRREGDGERKPFSGGERKPFGDRDRKPFGDRENKPYGDRPRREGDGERKSYGSGERKPFGDRDRKPFSGGERKPFSGGDRKPFGDRDNKPYGDRPRREADGERKSFGSGERRPFGDRDNKPYGDRPRREGAGDRDRKPFGGGDRKPFGDRESKPYGDRPRREGDGERRSYGDRDNRKPFGDRQERAPRSFDRGDSGPRQFGRDRAEDRPVRVPNARDLRSANRPDRERSPEIDEDVTGKELDRATQHQIKTLEEKSAVWVARHLVMAGRLIDDEPELAFQHALAASRRGGRLAAVREAVGLTAYAAGHYGEALREFRTYRRISGSNVHLPVMADCERGLGRPDRALDVVRSEEAKDLDAPGKAELAIVAAGARTDLNQLDAAVAELEIPQLDINRAFSYSPRLFRAYADALSAVGREVEAVKWQKQAVLAEKALGLGTDEEPDIVDLGWDEEEEAREEAEHRRMMQRAAAGPESGNTAAAVGVEAVAESSAPEPSQGVDSTVDDAESDYFESDDSESDEDSVEQDELASPAAESDAESGSESVDPEGPDSGSHSGDNTTAADDSERRED